MVNDDAGVEQDFPNVMGPLERVVNFQFIYIFSQSGIRGMNPLLNSVKCHHNLQGCLV